MKTEAPGCSPQVANTSAVEATELPVHLKDLNESQLEKLPLSHLMNLLSYKLL